MIYKGMIAAALAASALCFSSAQAASPVHEFTLDNGMKILIKEDHRAPVATTMVWYKVGSSYEHEGITGLSHVFEHMMFKGTEKYAPGEFSRIIAANGGSQNAFTSRDYTAYYQSMEASRIELSIEMEADRMRNVIILDDEFAKELEVVKEERRMRTEDKPESLVYEQFSAAAFMTSPYRNPVIGWMSDLDSMTADDLRSWYKTWYAPNNAILAIAGDVDPQQVYELANKHFGPIETSAIPSPKPRRDIQQKGERRISVKAPAELPYLLMGYKVPVIATTTDSMEPYALSVLSSIIDGGNSARFAKHLIREEQVVSSASAGYNPTARLNGLFMFDANPAKGHTVEDAEQAIQRQIKLLQTELVSDDELARVKAQVIAGDVYEKDSVFAQAMELGRLTTVGLDWRIGDQYVENIQKITAEQIREVARKYLVSDTLTVAVLEPQPLDRKKAPLRPLSGMRH